MTAQLRGPDRSIVAERMRRRYDAGATIADLMAAEDRSYGYIHALLKHAHTQFRPRGFEAGMGPRPHRTP